MNLTWTSDFPFRSSSRFHYTVYAVLVLSCAVVALRGPSFKLILGINLCFLAFLLWDKEYIWVLVAFLGDLLYSWYWHWQPLLPKYIPWPSHFVVGVSLF